MRATFQLVIILQNVQISSQYITHLKLIQYYVSAKKKKNIQKCLFWDICPGGNGNPLQCSCLENPRDGVAQSWTWLKRLSSSSSSPGTWLLDCMVSMCFACVLSCFSRVRLCDPMECSPPGSSVHGILQARILEWVAISFSRGAPRPKDQIQVSYVFCVGRWVLYHRRH